MAADELKGDDLIAEASKVFNTPGTGAPQAPETTGTPPPAPAPTGVKPDDIKGEDDLFREANRILGK